MNEVFQDVQSVIDGEIYLVGGSVRDLLLNRQPKDYDFCTSISPDDIETMVRSAGRRPYLIGKKFGTIGFKAAGNMVEVTTFRSERYTPGSRKPEVEYVSDLWADLARRDFTINAIALDREGVYRDPFGGRLDLLAKKIKSVGSAKDRFREDPLRMLRAARFSAQLDFDVDPNMVGTIGKMSGTILGISRERWVQELDKLLVSDVPERGIRLLVRTHLLKYMLPELWLQSCVPWLFDETINNIYAAPRDADSRWAALLLTVGKIFANESGVVYEYDMSFRDHNKIGTEVAKGICTRLKFSNQRTKLIIESIESQRIVNEKKETPEKA